MGRTRKARLAAFREARDRVQAERDRARKRAYEQRAAEREEVSSWHASGRD